MLSAAQGRRVHSVTRAALAAGPGPGAVASAAWLVLNPQMPAFASFYDASFEQHQAAADDPVLQQLNRVQRGLAVPGRHYWLPVVIAVATALVSWGLLTLAIALLT